MSFATEQEVAAHFKVPVKTIIRLRKNRRIPAMKVGTFWRYDLEKVGRAMEVDLPARSMCRPMRGGRI